MTTVHPYYTANTCLVGNGSQAFYTFSFVRFQYHFQYALFLHTGSDQKLEAEKAWEQGYLECLLIVV